MNSRGRRPPWSSLDDAVLRELHAAGHGVSYIATFMACARCTIHSRAKSLGIDFKEAHRWTAAEDDLLRQRYPNERSADVAHALGLPVDSVYRRANRIGLHKSEAFLASDLSARIQRGKQHPSMVASRFPKGHVPANKGMKHPKGWAPGRMRETQFKKGRPAHESRNYVPIGTEKVDKKRRVLMRKVTDDPSIFPVKRWRPVHVMVWEAVHGPVPDGHIVVFKPGRKTFRAEEITIDRLELVTLAENMRRNTIHNRYPKEVVQVIQLGGALKRKINNRTRGTE